MLIPLAIALNVAFAWGTRDYFSGRLAKKLSGPLVLFLTQLMGIFFFIPFLPAFQPPAKATIIGSLIIGINAVVSWLLFLKANKDGNISVVTPIARINFLITFLLGAIILNESVSFLKILGTSQIFIGGMLVAINWQKLKSIKQAKLYKGTFPALLAAGCSGLSLFLFTPLAKSGGWFYPALLVRIFVALLSLMFILITNHKLIAIKYHKIPWKIITTVGLADVLGLCLYNYAVSKYEVSYIAPIVSMSLLVTVLMASFFLKEKLKLSQKFGIGLILLGLASLQI